MPGRPYTFQRRNNQLLDDTLLTNFISTFYGYGTYAAPYWFVGMEEGGGGSLESARGRLAAWQRRGRKELEDPRGDAIDLSSSPWFRHDPKPRLQSTWKQLIRMALTAQGHTPSNEQIRDYQRDCLGRTDGDICLPELLPLPSPSTRHWFYKDYTTLPYLQSRDLYKQHLAPIRAAHLKQRISEHSPNAVVFYCMDWWYRHYWQEIAAVPFEVVPTPSGNILRATTPRTTFLIVKHPAAVGVTTRYFEEAGALLRDLR